MGSEDEVFEHVLGFWSWEWYLLTFLRRRGRILGVGSETYQKHCTTRITYHRRACVRGNEGESGRFLFTIPSFRIACLSMGFTLHYEGSARQADMIVAHQRGRARTILVHTCY